MAGLLDFLGGPTDLSNFDPSKLGLLQFLQQQAAAPAQPDPNTPPQAKAAAPMGLLSSLMGQVPLSPIPPDDSEADTPAAGAQPASLSAPPMSISAPPGLAPMSLAGATTAPAPATQPAAPAAAAPAASGGGFLDKIGNIYGAGGGGDGLINLGLALMSPGDRGTNLMRAAAMNQQGQLTAAQNQQKLMGLQGGVDLLRKAYPGMTDMQYAAMAQRPEIITEAAKRLNPSEQWSELPADSSGNVYLRNVNGDIKLKPQGKTSVSPLLTPEDRAAAGISPDDNAPYQRDETGKVSAVGGGGVKVYNGPQGDYNSTLTNSLAESHADLSKNVPASQEKLRSLNAMSGALQQIQQNGGTTGFGQDTVTNLKSAINSGANALGIAPPTDISSAEEMKKFGLQLAGAQAKAVGGARVTNFEMGNFLKANPSLELSPTGNQRILGIMQQVEQRNIAVGNQIRQMTADALTTNRKVDAGQVERMIRDYDTKNHIVDPISGQDITSNPSLPDLQGKSRPAASATTPTPGKFPSFRILP